MAQSDTAARSTPERLEPTSRSGARLPRVVLLAIGVVILGMIAGAVARNYWPGPPGDDSADAGFLRDMSTHHAQAVEMALIIGERTDDPTLKAFATDIALTQQGQIGAMSGWLQVWDLSMNSSDAPMTWMGHPTEGLMPGMATADDIRQLRDLPVDQAEVQFLRLMIRHHIGGVEMAEACLDRCDEDVVTRLSEGIVASQTGEINTMNDMLVARGEQPEPTTATGDGEHRTGEHATGTPAAG
jgi:uncharacterized protein (DUF305 family)